jgi:hypothetical protein
VEQATLSVLPDQVSLISVFDDKVFFGTSVLGGSVVGASVVGASVVGASVVGASVVGASVVGTSVVGASVVGISVVGVSVVGASVVVVSSFPPQEASTDVSISNTNSIDINFFIICPPFLFKWIIKVILYTYSLSYTVEFVNIIFSILLAPRCAKQKNAYALVRHKRFYY